MKLLFDQNISFRIIQKIEAEFPEAQQLRRLGLNNAEDRSIWEYAKSNEFVIVTCDIDFFELSNLYGQPPKVIWVRIPNPKTSELALAILRKKEAILSFIHVTSSNSPACLELT